MKLIVVSFVALSFSLTAFAKFSNESSVGVVSTTGNTALETYNAQTKSTYDYNKWDYALGGHYTLGTQEDVKTKDKVESARNWDANLRIGRVVHGNLSGFASHKIEGDKFAGYVERNNSDAGLTYTFYKNDKTYLFTDLGYRKQITTPVVGSAFESNKGRVYIETENKINANFLYKFWVEYIPDLKDAKKYGNQVNFEPSIAATLTDTFSLKVAYKGMYNSAPVAPATKHFDSIFTTSLIAKF